MSIDFLVAKSSITHPVNQNVFNTTFLFRMISDPTVF